MDEKLKAILANIESLVSQAKQMSGGTEAPEAQDMENEQTVTAEDVEKILKTLGMGAPEKGGEAIKKAENEDSTEDETEDAAEVKKSDEGTHANDSAEQIIGDQGEVNEKNIKEVAKAVAKIMKAQSVKKSTTVEPSVQKTLQTLADENRELRKSMEILLEGFGIANTVKQSTEVKKFQEVQKQEVDVNQLKKSLVDELKVSMKTEQPTGTGWGMDTMNTQPNTVRKSIGDALRSNMPMRQD